MRALLVATVLITQAPTPIFRFETDGFWLNLHHFLYVLGRVEARMPDIKRAAVAGAPDEQAAGLKDLSEADGRTWREAVVFYAKGLSQQDAVFDRALVDITNQLKRAPGDAKAASLKIDPAIANALDRAAPIYRRAWWPKHRDANRAWLASMQDPLQAYGPRILAYVTRAYQQPWAKDGYPVNVSGFSNWAGAYSTSFSLLVVSSLSPGNRGLLAFEIVFHEAMHQWDDAIDARLRQLATAHNTPPPKERLTHAMIFYTTGEAMRSVLPAYTPYAEVAGIWNGRMGAFKPALDAHWKPYLDGKTTLDESLIALLKS